MKKIEVVAAVIKKDDKFLATQRGYGEFEGMWEFPGGKIEINEDHHSALKREIKEELDVEIKINDFITTVEYDYPNFHLVMHCYFASTNEEISLLEHKDAKWLELNEFDSVNWLPADIDVVNAIIEQTKGTKIK